MELSFVYSGNETVGAMVVSRLEAAGCTRKSDDVALRGHRGDVLPRPARRWRTRTSTTRGSCRRRRRVALLIDLSASTPSFARELNAVADGERPGRWRRRSMVAGGGPRRRLRDRDNLVCCRGRRGAVADDDVPVLDAIVGRVQETGGTGSCAASRAPRTRCLADGAGDLGRGGRALYRAVPARRPRSTRRRSAWVQRPSRGRAGAGRGEHGAFRRHVHG